MNHWLRRFGYLAFIVIWLILISLPAIAFTLAARQQIQFGAEEGNHLRLFLIQERDAEGLGLVFARPSRPIPFLQANAPSTCVQTSVRYFLWVGEPENVNFCQCFEQDTNAPLSATAGKCGPP